MEEQKKQQIALQFHGVDFPVVNFQSKKPYDRKGEIKTGIEPKVMFLEEGEGRFQVVMNVSLVAEDFFELKVQAVGKFVLPVENPSDAVKGEVAKSASNTMFPFVRSFVNTLSTNMGTPTNGPLILPPQFFGNAKKAEA